MSPNGADYASLPSSDDTLRRILPNGITVLVRENRASPAVVVNGYLQVGSQDEPRDMQGLAGFVVDTMERGTQERDFGKLYEEVESIGAGFGLSSGTHITSFGAKGLADSLGLLLEILSDVLRNPAFDPLQVEKVRTEILTDLQERTHDTRRMARLKFYELAYPPTHPYHWSQLGYPETIAEIRREDLIGFHSTYFASEDLVIVIVGGIDAEVALEAVMQIFGSWDKHRPPRVSLPEVTALTERREDRSTLADKTQSSLCLGWPGPQRSDPDFIPCFVTNTLLGVFGMYGRLGRSIRETHGLAYYIYSRLDGGMGPGPWRILGGFDPANTDRALELILQELVALRTNPVDETELQDSQSYLVGSLPLYLETNEGVARSLVNIERYRLGLDYLRRYQALIKAVTPEQIQDAARKWLDPERFALAIAGPPAASSPRVT